MEHHSKVYALSKSYGPPKINLRDAHILDSYGDDRSATRPVSHKVPEDVSKADLDFYAWVYPFMEFGDLLFYLYPIALEYEKDINADFIDSFMYNLDLWLPSKLCKLPQKEQDAVILAIRWIWDSGNPDTTDWDQCPSLQRAIGLSD